MLLSLSEALAALWLRILLSVEKLDCRSSVERDPVSPNVFDNGEISNVIWKFDSCVAGEKQRFGVGVDRKCSRLEE